MPITRDLAKAPKSSVKPLIQLAAFCEKIMQEKDNVISAIRLVDTFFGPKEALGSEVPVVVTLGISLKNGLIEEPTNYTIGLSLRRPSGSVSVPGTTAIAAMGERGPSAGSIIVMHVPIKFSEEGTHWMDITCDGEVLTTIPFRLLIAPADQS